MIVDIGGEGANNARCYDDLIALFGEDKILDRCCYLESSAKRYIENRQIQNYVKINSFIIQEIVLDYFADIKRLKEFHEITRIRQTKIAAYTAFWICRRKPLYLSETVDGAITNKIPGLIEINELFACSMMISITFDLCERWLLNAERMSLWTSFHSQLQYFLVYRIFTPQSLELALEALSVDSMYPLQVAVPA